MLQTKGPIMKFQLALAGAVFFAATLNGIAWSTLGGGMDTGGVDSIALRRVQIQTLINGMQGDILAYLGSINAERLTIEGASEIRELVSLGLAQDIRITPYAVREECTNNAGEVVAASTQVGIPGAEVCINIAKLSSQPVVPTEIYSIIVHEHAHHLGAGSDSVGEDRANRLGAALGPQVAAYRFFHPRADVLVGNNPVLERPTGACLSLSVLAEKWRAEEGYVTMINQDMSIESLNPSIELPHWTSAIGSSATSIQTLRARSFWGGKSYYQTGCEYLLEERHDGSFVRLPILRSGPSYIEFFSPMGAKPDSLGVNIRVTANHGHDSQELTWESSLNEDSELHCTLLENSNRVLVDHIGLHVWIQSAIIHTSKIPDPTSLWVNVTLRALKLSSEGAMTNTGLTSGATGLPGDFENRKYSTCNIQGQLLPIQ